MSHRALCTILPLALIFGVGCSNTPDRIPQPDIDAQDVAEQAVTTYDRNGDGRLSSDELSSVRSLSRSLRRLDGNGDESLDAGEIAARIESWQQYGAGLIPATCTVLKQGKPVKGATVVYTPEPFFDGALHPAMGKTNGSGRTIVSVGPEHRPTPVYRGVQTGFFQISITLEDGSRVDNLNDGVEVAGDLRNDYTVHLP